MREIKFRGKDKWGNWRYGDLMKNSIPTASPVIVEDFYYDDPDDSMFEVNPDTVGQFTGLRDMDDNPIYEGDIVIWYDGSSPSVVRWDSNSGYFVFMESLILGHAYKALQVIGNVHDNPDLLKEGGE